MRKHLHFPTSTPVDSLDRTGDGTDGLLIYVFLEYPVEM